MMSSSTTSLVDRVRVPDCLRTNGFACPMIASLSSVCLARISWTMPMTLLAMSRPNIPLIQRARRQDDEQQNAQNRVDPREYVGPDDLPDGAGDPFRDIVALAFGDPLRHFGIGQTGCRRSRTGHRVNVPSLSAS